MFRKEEAAEFPGELEGGEDGILGRQRDERRTGKGSVGVDSRTRMSQGILLSRVNTVIAATSATSKSDAKGEQGLSKDNLRCARMWTQFTHLDALREVKDA